MSDNDTKPVITINPDPPTQGQQCTIHYTGTPGTRLDLEWSPTGLQPTTVTVDSNGNATITIPDSAVTLKITDPTPNGALAKSTPIQPA
jgi:hypothetical protein